MSTTWAAVLQMLTPAEEGEREDDWYSAMQAYLKEHQETLKSEEPSSNPIRVMIDSGWILSPQEYRETLEQLLTNDPATRKKRVQKWIINTACPNIVTRGLLFHFHLGKILFEYAEAHFKHYIQQAEYLTEIAEAVVEDLINDDYGSNFDIIGDNLKWVMEQDGARLFTRTTFLRMCEYVREKHVTGLVRQHPEYYDDLLMAAVQLSSCVGITDILREHYDQYPKKHYKDNEEDFVTKSMIQLLGRAYLFDKYDKDTALHTLSKSFRQEKEEVKARHCQQKRKRVEQEESRKRARS